MLQLFPKGQLGVNLAGELCSAVPMVTVGSFKLRWQRVINALSADTVTQIRSRGPSVSGWVIHRRHHETIIGSYINQADRIFPWYYLVVCVRCTFAVNV